MAVRLVKKLVFTIRNNNIYYFKTKQDNDMFGEARLSPRTRLETMFQKWY